MDKVFTKFEWRNSPDESTPLNQLNLNKINNALDIIDTRVVTHNSTKLDVVEDLATIRELAALGATAYQKPENGIIKADLEESILLSLDKADTAILSLDGYATEGWVESSILLALPTKVSLLENDSNYITSAYHDNTKLNISDLPTEVSSFTNDAGYITTSYHDDTKADIEEVPVRVSDLENDIGFITSNYHDATKADIELIPAKVSDLENDVPFLVAADITGKVSTGEFYSHTSDIDIHTTLDLQLLWNTVADKVDRTAFDLHTNNNDIHVTATKLAEWDTVNNKVDIAAFATHVDNTDIHITSELLLLWNTVEDKETKGVVTINGTEYPIIVATSGTGTPGYITIIVED